MFTHYYRQLPAHFYSDVLPEPMQGARLAFVNRALQQQLNFSVSDEDLLGVLSGQKLLAGMTPLAQKYTGHQFGYYNPDLGDGRGMLLGQFSLDEAAKKHQARLNLAPNWVDFHLKGAGRTPYSRRGDGRAVLRSSIRELLASEALFGLGVPTTRALGLATSFEPSEQVRRETYEPRATLLRVTPSHIRFGHFEWAAEQGKADLNVLLKAVLDWHYPHLKTAENPAAALLKEVCERTAKLMAMWQSVGFNHGVMNSDNFSILGETFDFGPYAFFDDFEIGHICNHSDDQGRYAYSEQPKIGLWNCRVLAHALKDLMTDEAAEAALNHYITTYNTTYISRMMLKIGCVTVLENDKHFIGNLLVLMDQQRVDFNLFFRRLAGGFSAENIELMALLSQPKLFDDWFLDYAARLQLENRSSDDIAKTILENSPAVYLRNYIAQEIIEAAEKGDFSRLDFWVPKLQNPFIDYPELQNYQQPPKAHSKNMVLSCSS